MFCAQLTISVSWNVHITGQCFISQRWRITCARCVIWFLSIFFISECLSVAFVVLAFITMPSILCLHSIFHAVRTLSSISGFSLLWLLAFLLLLLVCAARNFQLKIEFKFIAILCFVVTDVDLMIIHRGSFWVAADLFGGPIVYSAWIKKKKNRQSSSTQNLCSCLWELYIIISDTMNLSFANVCAIVVSNSCLIIRRVSLTRVSMYKSSEQQQKRRKKCWIKRRAT